MQRQFSGLRAQLPILLSLGLGGVPFMGCDIGGFDCGPEDAELYIRWMEFGTFSPMMRAHGVNAITEPVYFDSVTRAVVADYIRLRYALLPYHYTLAWEATRTGTPLARPLFWSEPNGAPLDFHDEYLWGDAFLVAPVMEAGQRSRSVYLPGGMWFDYWTDERVVGNHSITVDAPLEKLPLLVKAGCFVPMIPPIETTRDYDTDTLIVHTYVDPSEPAFDRILYEDDGASPDAFALGQYETIAFDGLMAEDCLSVRVARTHAGYAGSPNIRKMIFPVHGIASSPIRVAVVGHELPRVENLDDFYRMDSAAFWNADRDLLYAGFVWDNQPTELSIVWPSASVPDERPALDPSANLTITPNPFNATTQIIFSLPQAGKVTLALYDLLGQRVQTLTDSHFDAGEHRLRLDMSGLPTGLYFARLDCPRASLCRKLMLMR